MAEARAINPGITIEKYVYSGHTTGTGIGTKLLTGTSGEAITYLFKVTNDSDTFLKDIIVTDEKISIGGVYLTNGGMVLRGDSSAVPLATGKSIIYYYQTTLAGDLENTVRVIATPCDASGTEYAEAVKPTHVATAKVEIESSIGDFVWYDINGDGKQDASEPGVAGVVVNLSSGGIIIRTTTTDSVGWYTFSKLPSGTYEVIVAPGSELDGYKQTYDLDGGSDNRATVKLETNKNRTDVDFGYEPIPSLSFTKTVDKAYVKRGDTVTYSLTVLNDGKTDLENIKISDAAVGIDITIPKLVSNASITTSVAFVIPAGAPMGPWVNIAEAKSSTTAIVTDDAITTVYKPSSPPPVVTPPAVVTPPVITPPVDPPVGPGGGTVDTEEDTPIEGTVPGTGGTVVTPPGDGTVTVDEDGKWTYTPDPGFTGTDSFVIMTLDEDGIPSSYEFIVNVLDKGNLGLPKTGGIDQGFLYLTGLLLILLGLIILRRRYSLHSKRRRA